MKPSEYDWLSAADFRLGHRAQVAGDLHRARAFYARVIGQHPEHVSARHNAAVVEIRAGRPDVALTHLDVLDTRLARDEPRNDRTISIGIGPFTVERRRPRGQQRRDQRIDAVREALDLSLLYNRALAYATAFDDQPANFVRAEQCSAQLITRVLEIMIAYEPSPGDRRGRAHTTDEREAVRRLAPSAAVFHGSMLLESGKAPWEYAVDEATGKSSGKRESPDGVGPSELAKMDPPDHWPPLAARYAAAADPRARYNLACYLARLQRHAGRDKQNELTRSARSHLRHALQDADLLAWTDRDPALAPVRDADPDRWKAMLAELGAGAVNALPPGNAEAEEQSASATARSPEHSQPARFEPLADYAEAYRWRLISGHRALAVSSRSFPTEGEALRAARDIRNQVGDAQFRLAGESAAARRGWEFVFQAGPGFGQQSWDLVDAEGRSVARAPRWFGSLSAAVAAAESVQSRARDAELEDDPPANAESATTA